ncbi:hypothetical protein OHB26_38900 (plasmid) [Nocardia sp. NBC_01503]|uniref:hypothetical protein n=1 Tax=Nocardia sp. NBC_01503 TaxID=2975997 RepID=UPI002E7B03D3|nr:hypothetical protein [Nocardia sp. NBC_01503]WTL36648.1 hypothetical protein OHB26_38900 [Nocardia sp. NBC_01503]
MGSSKPSSPQQMDMSKKTEALFREAMLRETDAGDWIDENAMGGMGFRQLTADERAVTVAKAAAAQTDAVLLELPDF